MKPRWIYSETKIYVCNFIISYVPLHFVRLFYYRYMMGYKIGKGSSIHMGCKFNGSGLLYIGENSTVNQFCRLDNRASITIGDNVSVSPYVKILTADHDVNHPQCQGRERAIVIEDYVFIGSDAMLLGGVHMRKGSVLAAKSLLTKSTEAFGIYMGMPAVWKSQRNQNINYSGSYRRLFN